MKLSLFVLCLLVLLSSLCVGATPGQAVSRPPAVPRVARDPYFSVWSFADALTDKGTVHWTDRSQALASLTRIDGKTYRLMGREPAVLPALTQTGLQVLPTRTIYAFEGTGVHVTMTLMQAARAALRQGKNTLAVYCTQTGGGQNIDMGFAQVIAQDWRFRQL